MAFEFEHSAKNPLHPVSYLKMRAMHSRLEIVWTGQQEISAQDLAQKIHESMLSMEREFNRFSEKSPLSVINLKASREDVCIGEDLFMALELCEAFRRGTRAYSSPRQCMGLRQMHRSLPPHSYGPQSGHVDIPYSIFLARAHNPSYPVRP